MLEIKIEKSFKKDIQRDKNSGNYSKKDFELLKSIILKLQNEETIDESFKRHLLKGDMKELESIHIKGDWLLIFFIDEKYLNLIMLGKHTQVYKKFK
jgi:mRNA interferase YafQ